MIALAWTFFLAIGGFSQSPVLPGEVPAGQIPVPDLERKIQEMRDAGIPEERILELIKAEVSAQTAQPANNPAVPVSAPQEQLPEPAPAPSGAPAPEPPAQPVAPQPVAPTDPAPAVSPVDMAILTEEAKELPTDIFGHDIFRREPAPDSIGRLTPPKGYLIGPGDVFVISIYGPSERFESLPVRDDGAVMRQFFGKIYLAGMTYQEAKDLLLLRYQRIVDPRSVIEINLTPNPRTIGVNIVGEVRKPGYYQIPASLPAFRAIIRAGGISDIGTVRNIQIKRDGRVVHTIDIYKYLLEGEDESFYLREDDFIYVPTQGRIVRVSGAVLRPQRYELLPNEQLNALIQFAGGLTSVAKTDQMEITRIEEVPSTQPGAPRLEKRAIVLNIDYDEIRKLPPGDYFMYDNDVLSIRGVNTKLVNEVNIYGSVQFPYKYQLIEGERVSDIITRAGGLTEDAYLDRAYVVRKNPAIREAQYIPIDLRTIFPDSLHADLQAADNIELQFKDILLIFSNYTFLQERKTQVVGQVKKPGYYTAYPGMSLKDLLFLAGGPRENADLSTVELSLISTPDDVNIGNFEEGAVNPLEPGQTGDGDTEGEAKLIRRVEIPENWRDAPELDTIMVFGYNRVRFFSKYDFIFTRNLVVQGAVKRPLTLPVSRGMTLLDVLYQAGGLTEPSIANEVELYRVISVAEKGNYGTKETEAEIRRIRIRGDWRNDPLLDTLDITSYYKVVIRSESEFLQEGRVTIKGLVGSPGTYSVRPGMTLYDLLYMAGGLQLTADADRIELTRIIEVQGEDGTIYPIPTDLRLVSTSQNWMEDSALKSVPIFSFDQIFVRADPDFKLQESVFVEGEIITPGEYNKSFRYERLSSLVARANGITELSYLEGAYLIRKDIGKVSIQLDKALRRPGSKFDLRLLEGDVLVIPARTDAVTIEGNVLQPGTIVMFEPSHQRFKYYTDLAGGFAKRTLRRNCTVTYVDGKVKRAKKIFFIRIYPKVKQGALLTVAEKPAKRGQDGEGDRQRVRFNLEEVLSSATAILTFWVLLERVNP